MRDPEVADRIAREGGGVSVIDDRTATGLTVSRAVLAALGVQQGQRVTALTSAVEKLPEGVARASA